MRADVVVLSRPVNLHELQKAWKDLEFPTVVRFSLDTPTLLRFTFSRKHVEWDPASFRQALSMAIHKAGSDLQAEG